MIEEFGEMKGNILQQLPFDNTEDSIPGRIYHLTLRYEGRITDPQALCNAFETEFSNQRYRGAKLYYLSIDEENKTINIQLSGSPFAWSYVPAYLPLVMTVSGIVLVGVALFDVLTVIPGWAWAILIIGGLLIIASPIVAGRS